MADATLLDDVHAAATKVTWTYLATVAGGRPKVRVVHPIWEGSTLWIATGAGSAKARHIGRDPHVELFYQVAMPDLTHLTVTGRARLVEDADEKRRVWRRS